MYEYAIKDKFSLANYIKRKYQEIYSEEISPLKLQKSLYFLFGYYILEKEVENELEGNGLEGNGLEGNGSVEFLFDSNFQAWKYGPVERDIYYDSGVSSDKEEMSNKLKNFIDNNLEKIFKISDFGLVNISHTHKCWKEVYRNMENNPIPAEQIKKTFLEILEQNN